VNTVPEKVSRLLPKTFSSNFSRTFESVSSIFFNSHFVPWISKIC
jgi:hypothetical protein